MISDIYKTPREKEDTKNQNASIFFIKYSKLKLKNESRFSTNRIINEEIGTSNSKTPPFHYLSQNSIRKHISRNKIENSKIDLTTNEFDSLKKMCEDYMSKNGNENDFLLCESDGDNLIWAFALAQMKEVAILSNEWHIDATYKILKNKRGLWIISTKQDLTERVFPLLFFIIPNERSSTLSEVLEAYKEWVGFSPESFIADCQKSIENSISDTFDDSKFFLCIFHILRAVKKQLSQLINNSEIAGEAFNLFYQIAMCAYIEQDEIDKNIHDLKDLLIVNGKRDAWNYLYKNYFKNEKIKLWAKQYREGYSMTNNISESLNKVIKSYYKIDSGMRMDKLCYLIMNTICKDFVFETFKGRNEISDRVEKNEATINLLKKSDLEREMDNLIKRIRGSFRCSSHAQQAKLIEELKEFCDVSLE